MPVMINYDFVRHEALIAVNNYLAGRVETEGDRDGFFHGVKGQRRALKVGAYLSSRYCENNPAAILTVLSAVFGEHKEGIFNWSFGRSTRLAGLIADRIIAGSHSSLAAEVTTIQSIYFSEQELGQSMHNMENHRVIPSQTNGYSYFDKTRGVRELLQKALHHDVEDEGQRKLLETKIRRIREILDDEKSEKIDLNILPLKIPIAKYERVALLPISYPNP